MLGPSSVDPTERALIYYLVVTLHTDVRDKDNRTPLHWACLRGRKKVAQYLVEEVKCDAGECICQG